MFIVTKKVILTPGQSAIVGGRFRTVVIDQESGKLQNNLTIKKALVDLKGKEYPEVNKFTNTFHNRKMNYKHSPYTFCHKINNPAFY